MATPLGDMLRQLRTDTEIHERFHRSPGEYLHEHGWGDLDAADVQEALLLLADGAPAPEAAQWVAAGEAVDPTAPDPAGALDAALSGLGDLAVDDPDDIDGLDRPDADALDDHADPHGLDGFDDLDDLDDLGDVDDLDGAASDPGMPTPSPAAAPTPIAAATTDGIDPLDDADAAIDPFDPVHDPFADDDPISLTTDADDRPDADPEPEPDWDDPT